MSNTLTIHLQKLLDEEKRHSDYYRKMACRLCTMINMSLGLRASFQIGCGSPETPSDELEKSVRKLLDMRLIQPDRGRSPSAAATPAPQSPNDPSHESPPSHPLPRGKDYLAISDHQLDELQDLVNATIHELVFLQQHADQHDASDCADILTTIKLNIGQIHALVLPGA
jgi:hypothetical protein